MDITSFLLGKQAAGGGGGGGTGYDWSAIGYSNAPTWLNDGYNYAKQIYDNWDNTATSTRNMFNGDDKLLIFPKVDTSNVADFVNMFNDCQRVQEIELDLSSATNVSTYLYNCRGLRKLKLKGNTNITNLGFAGSNLISVETIDLNELTANNVNTFMNIFSGCMSLKNLYMNNLNTSKVSNASYMFYNCTKLESLDLSFFDITALTNVSYMFYYATAITHLDIRTFDFSQFTSTDRIFGNYAYEGVPDDCEIIVADDTQKAWVNTNYPRLTNVKTVAEL